MRLDSIIGIQPFFVFVSDVKCFQLGKIEIANQSSAIIIVLIILLS